MRKIILGIVLGLFLMSSPFYLARANETSWLPPDIFEAFMIAKYSGFVYEEEAFWQNEALAPYELEANGMRGDCEDGALWLLHQYTKRGYQCALVFGTTTRHSYSKFAGIHVYVRVVSYTTDVPTMWDIDICAMQVWQTYFPIEPREDWLEEINEAKRRQDQWEKQSRKEIKEHYDIHENGTFKSEEKK